MATDSEIPAPLLDKQVKVYAAINAVTAVLAAEPKHPQERGTAHARAATGPR